MFAASRGKLPTHEQHGEYLEAATRPTRLPFPQQFGEESGSQTVPPHSKNMVLVGFWLELGRRRSRSTVVFLPVTLERLIISFVVPPVVFFYLYVWPGISPGR